jgi:ATP-dependent DNA ligase
VRLSTRGGYDRTKRYPWITEAARKVRQRRIVLDGEAEVPGVDRVSDVSAPASTMKRSSSAPLASGITSGRRLALWL